MADLGQVFTKKNVAQFMISLCEIAPNDYILDPCFGAGVFVEELHKKGYKNIYGCELDSKLFNKISSKYSNLYCCDFLTKKFNRKFDLIIMNPPYIRHEKINDLQEYGINKSLIQSNVMYSKLPKNANMYMYFIVKSISLLKKNGQLVVIFPGSWQKSSSGKKFIKEINNSCSIVEIINVHGDVFEDNVLTDVVIMKLKKNLDNNKCKNYDAFFENNRIYYKDNVEYQEVDGSCIKFNDIFKIKRGLTTGYNDAFINPPVTNEKCLKKIVSTPKQILGYTTKNSKYDNILVVDDSELCNKYLIKIENKIIKEGKPTTLYNKIINNKKWYEIKIFNCTGIIFNYFIRNEIKFIYNEDFEMVRDNFYIINCDFDEKLAFALLNNYYVYYQLEKIGKKYGNGLLKIQKYDFNNLNIVDPLKITINDKKKLIELSEKIISGKSKNGIDEISIILSKYMSINFEKIKEIYDFVKTNRLEA